MSIIFLFIAGVLLISLGLAGSFGFFIMHRKKKLSLAWGGNNLVLFSLFFAMAGVYLLTSL